MDDGWQMEWRYIKLLFHIDYWISKEASGKWQTGVTNYYHKKIFFELIAGGNKALKAISSLERCLKWEYPPEMVIQRTLSILLLLFSLLYLSTY